MADVTAPAPTEFDLTVDEFCMRLSSSDPSIEMVAGFHSDELAKGHTKDSSAAFNRRYEAFKTRVVA